MNIHRVVASWKLPYQPTLRGYSPPEVCSMGVIDLSIDSASGGNMSKSLVLLSLYQHNRYGVRGSLVCRLYKRAGPFFHEYKEIKEHRVNLDNHPWTLVVKEV